jgi:hypothetical protein
MGTKMEYCAFYGVTYPLDTDAEIETAQAAMRDLCVPEVRIYVGSPDCPDSYESIRVLYAGTDDCELGA